jgi:hypothetical protein
MVADCAAPVTMLDRKGYVYCEPHGVQRRASGTATRRLSPAERARLAAGLTVARY